jgi:hypothetical protein
VHIVKKGELGMIVLLMRTGERDHTLHLFAIRKEVGVNLDV